MLGNLSKSTFLVVSDTAMYAEAGIIYAYEPVVRELESIASLFDSIVWLGSRIEAKAGNLVQVDINKIKCVVLPSVRRKKFNFLFVLAGYVSFLFYLLKYIPKATHIHTRGPSHPALLAILFSFFDKRKQYWHKYAGNWITDNLPVTYKLQRSLLRKITHGNIRITVNGQWHEANKRIMAFENPCMYEAERLVAVAVTKQKKFSEPLNLVFVGDLTKKKGILELMECVEQGNIPSVFKEIYIVGDGELYHELKLRAAKINYISIILTGKLNRAELNLIYSKCHILILPSSAEGFPKVIAEGAAYGCVPVVTDISSLSQYIEDGKSGFLMKNNTAQTIGETLKRISLVDDLEQVSKAVVPICDKFTYEYFRDRIQNEIFVL
jgi:glycosyltransferase involved in cell wall biosynthesis